MMRKTFVSYSHALDQHAADDFRKVFADDRNVFIDKSQREDIGWQADSTIKEKLKKDIRDSSVTVVLIGSETGGRPWIDWEIYYSLSVQENNYRNGLLGILIPHKQHWVPPRLRENEHMGKIIEWPKNYKTLSNAIEEVYQKRDNDPNLSRRLKQRNS